MNHLEQYGNLRGFNYTPSTAFNDIAFWRDYDERLVERELGYAHRLGLNSARVFLSYVVYEHDRALFLARLRHFVREAHDRGISVMPVIWDGCFDESVPSYDANENKWIPNPGVHRLGPDFWEAGEAYCADLVECLKDEPGVLMWDVMNEPLITTWIEVDEPLRTERVEVTWRFVRHFCDVMRRLDDRHPVTVGVHTPDNLTAIGQAVDVLSFHDYSHDRAAIRAKIERGLDLARELDKPILLSEMCCLARANPYDVSIETCQEIGIGWYLWELMIGESCWRDIHGIVYPDGTVRDPSIVAAIGGFFRKRHGPVVPPDVDKEGVATRVTAEATTWLGDGTRSYSDGLRVAERLANLLETGELVPMNDLPSAKVLRLAEDAESDANQAELLRLVSLWNEELSRYIHSGAVAI